VAVGITHVVIGLNPHNGNGPSWLVPAVADRPFNVGEVAHPLNATARIVVGYNGYWGCTNSKDLYGFGPERRSPTSFGTHCEWQWPDGNPVDQCEH
jgi:hypothetical protein